MYGARMFFSVRRPGVAACGGNRAADQHVADLAEAGFAAERERLAAHHLDAVVLAGVVRRGDLRAAFEPLAGHREVQHVGRHHPEVHDVAALRERPLDERGGNRGRREAHVARHADSSGAEIGDERAADLAGDLLVDLTGIHAPHVVGLENALVHVHVAPRF